MHLNLWFVHGKMALSGFLGHFPTKAGPQSKEGRAHNFPTKGPGFVGKWLFWVQGLVFRVQGPGVQGLGVRVSGLGAGFRV